MTNELLRHLASLRGAGWRVDERTGAIGVGANPIATRHPILPEEYLDFLASVDRCNDPADQVWFLSTADFSGTSDAAFSWDEFERQSLDAAQGDAAWRAEIAKHWDAHLPILFSVVDGYAYAALVTQGRDVGKVVAGREPEYEEVREVAPSFMEFLSELVGVVEGRSGAARVADLIGRK